MSTQLRSPGDRWARFGPSRWPLMAVMAVMAGCMPGPADDGGEGGTLPTDTSRIIVTTTDFATGAVSVVSPEGRAVQRDVALASTDAIPHVHDGLVYVVNRFMFDYVDVYDPEDDWALMAEHPIDDVTDQGAPTTNPHAVAFAADGRAFVVLYGTGTVQVHDFSAVSGESYRGEIDLHGFADDDGIAEASVVFAHGDEIWVALARVARAQGWSPVGSAELVLIDAASESPHIVDLDPGRAGAQGLTVPGIGLRQVRRDPKDPDRVYLLANGVVAVDLRARSSEWVVSDEQMAAAGIPEQLLPQSFDITDDGDRLVIAAYRPDFSGIDLFTVPAQGGVPTVLVSGLNAVERTLEVIGDEIWFGDTSMGASGMRAYDMQGAPLFESALGTGLDPYSVVELSSSP